MKKAIFSLITVAFSLQANTSLDIYTNKFFLSHSFDSPKEIELQVPAYTTLENIFYKMDQNCVLNSQNLTKSKKLENKNLEKLQEKKTTLQIKEKALKAKENLLHTLSLNEGFDLQKIEKMSAYLEKNTIKIENELAKMEKEIEQVTSQINEIQSKPQEYKTLHVSFTCKKDSSVIISYPSQDIGYKPFYEVSANTTKNSLTISSKASLIYKGFEDLKNIQIHIFSHAYNQNINPTPFYPQYLGETEEYDSIRMTKALSFSEKAQNVVAKRQDLQTLYSYTLSHKNLLPNKTVLLSLEKQKLNATYTYLIDAYGTSKAYIQADFQPQKTLIDGSAKLFINSLPLGDIYLPKLTKKVESSLYFGENQFVHVKKELLSTQEDKGFFAGTTSIRKWKYTLNNTSNQAVKINFVTRTPISKDPDIKVKTIAKPDFTKQNAEGKTSWEFTLQPAEVKEIIFGYEINKSK